MSVVYEPRNFIHDGSYPPIDDPHDDANDTDRYADTVDSVVNDLASVANYNAPNTFIESGEGRLDFPSPPLQKIESPSPMTHSPSAPLRMKAIPKPDREATRNGQGKFVCTFPGCTEEVKEFTRKCEWNKHMDKHDRPYKCSIPGCEKLAGFTYSGGLLRHEREVHNRHGGPKNSFNCPHPNCKRHCGKGFSRLENLNEHLRRVHTPNGGHIEGETDDAGSDQATLGMKRTYPEDDDPREEIKRLRQENDDLRQQVHALTQQSLVMMQKITALQDALSTRLMTNQLRDTMPTAPMV